MTSCEQYVITWKISMCNSITQVKIDIKNKSRYTTCGGKKHVKKKTVSKEKLKRNVKKKNYMQFL